MKYRKWTLEQKLFIICFPPTFSCRHFISENSITLQGLRDIDLKLLEHDKNFNEIFRRPVTFSRKSVIGIMCFWRKKEIKHKRPVFYLPNMLQLGLLKIRQKNGRIFPSELIDGETT